MKYKVLITALALAVVTGLTVRAEDQPTTPPKQGGGHHGHGGLLPPPALEKLNLTADQKAKYDAIAADYAKDAAPVREKMKAAHDAGDKDKMKELYQELMPIRKAAIEKVEQFLTDDQKAELKKLREEHGHGGGHDKPAPAPQQ